MEQQPSCSLAKYNPCRLNWRATFIAPIIGPSRDTIREARFSTDGTRSAVQDKIVRLHREFSMHKWAKASKDPHLTIAEPKFCGLSTVDYVHIPAASSETS